MSKQRLAQALVLKLVMLLMSLSPQSLWVLWKGKENVHKAKLRNGALSVLDPWRRVFSSKIWTADDEPTPENRGPVGPAQLSTEPSWA